MHDEEQSTGAVQCSATARTTASETIVQQRIHPSQFVFRLFDFRKGQSFQDMGQVISKALHIKASKVGMPYMGQVWMLVAHSSDDKKHKSVVPSV